MKNSTLMPCLAYMSLNYALPVAWDPKMDKKPKVDKKLKS